MKINIQKLPQSQIEISVELSAELFQNFIEKTIKNLGQGIEVPGFRKGSAPKEVIKNHIGEGKILQQAAETAINENYPKVLLQLKQENKIKPIGQPEVQVLKLAENNSLIYKIKLSILPEIKLGDYKKIASQIKQKEISVEEAEVEKTLNWLQKQRAKFSQIDRPAQKQDWIEIEYSSLAIEEGKIIKDKFILGEGKLVKGFEENIEGMRQGDTKEFSLDVPFDYHYKQIAGTKVYFKVKLISLQKMELPELSDEWAKSVGKFENLANLKQNLKDNIKKEKQETEKQRTREEILGKITKQSSLEVPENMIEFEKNRLLENLKKNISEKFNLQFEEYLKKNNLKQEEIEKSFFQQAQQRLKNFLILKEIANKENISVSKQEIEEQINKTLKENPDIKDLDIEKTKAYIEEVITNEKVFDLLEK